MSGDTPEAHEMVRLIIPEVLAYDKLPKIEGDFDVRIGTLLEGLRKAAHKRKRSVVEHYLAMKHAMTRDEFLKIGKDAFPLEMYSLIAKNIEDLSIGCEIIVSYVQDEEPVIIKIFMDGYVAIQENYACIGNGDIIAQSFLRQENWDQDMPLEECLLRIFSAKVASQKGTNVGEATTFDILVEGQGWHDISSEAFEFLTENYPRLVVPKNPKFPNNFLLNHSGFPPKLEDEIWQRTTN
jgi:hypothetical protein